MFYLTFINKFLKNFKKNYNPALTYNRKMFYKIDPWSWLRVSPWQDADAVDSAESLDAVVHDDVPILTGQDLEKESATKTKSKVKTLKLKMDFCCQWADLKNKQAKVIQLHFFYKLCDTQELSRATLKSIVLVFKSKF